MGKLIMKSAPLSGDPEVKVPSFNFCRYEAGQEYHNDENRIDFVTDGKSLYVCLVSHTATEANVANEQGFLKLVSEGPQGIQGIKGDDGSDAVTPVMSAEFIGDQLKLIINNKIAALSPSLTGPSWKPVLEDNVITWELTNDRYAPESIDLETLRPIQKSPLLLRTNSDNTKRSDETSGPANFIQWKYEGDEYWTNLISISELMNLALAGVSVWKNEDDQKWHLGHREVIKATYDSDKNGRKIISNVRLGDILFDAGELPFAEQQEGQDYGPDIDLIYAKLAQLEADMVKTVNHVGPDANGNVNVDGSGSIPSLDGYATQNWVSANYQPKGNYVTSVNGVSPQPGSNGAITIDVGNLGSFDIRLKNDGKTLEKTVNGTTWTDIVDLSQFEGSGSGCNKCWSQEEIVQLIENVLSGRIPTNIVVPSDLDAYVRWTDISGTYATMSWVSDEIARALSGGQYEPEYHRVFTLYQRTNDRLTPPNPPLANVWEWNLTDGDILTDESHKSGWDNHPQNATTALPYLWMASATFSSITHKEVKPSNASSAWTLVCLTGEAGLAGANGFNGTDGADGNGVEFIFTLVRDINDKNSVDTPVAPSSSQADSYPAGWEDHPQGIGYYIPNQITTTLENLGNNEILFGIELASMRTYTNGQWGPYCAPFIWSMWGEDGIDGDGVEYIFIVADENSTDINTTTGKIALQEQLWKVEGSSPNFIPTTEEQVRHLGSSYQVPDWIGTRNNGWTDNPSDVDTQQPFEFVAIRKYHDGTGWGPFCEPKLWSHFGGITVNPVTTITTSAETNYVPYKEWAFYRANDTDGTTHTDLSTYDVVYDFSSFGTQSNPDPVYSDLTPEQKLQFYRNPELYTKTVKNGQVLNITWQDTVPSGDGQLWVITAHIADESQSTDQGWTTPSRWGDKAGFNVEYSASEEASIVYDNPSLWNNHNLTFNDFQGSDEQRESDWRTSVEDAGYGIWNDVVEEPKYMATTVLGENGIWSKWTITKIVGEDGARGQQGEPGQDGNGVEFVFFALTPEQYNNRSNFIGNDNKFYVYDNLEHDQKTWQENEYLPYAIISNVPEGRLWATDDNPGITEERPYVFVSARHQVEGQWNQFHNIPGTGLMTSFGPASLWLAGDEIDYEASTINVSDDTIQIDIDPETKYPVSKTFSSDTNSIQFYHGLKALSVDEIRVFVNDSWELLGKVVAKSNESGYEYVPSEVITNFGQLTSKLSVDEYGKPRAFWLSVTPTAETVFVEQNVKLRFYSIDGFINELGVYSHYVAELNIDLIPVESSNYLVLTDQDETVLKKSSADALVYEPNLGVLWVVALNKKNEGLYYSPDDRLEGIQSIPGDYSKWTLDIDFDDNTYYTGCLIGSIYRNWVLNVKTNNDNSNDSIYYKLDGTICNNRQYPIVINCYKTFYGDGHYFHDFLIIQINPDKYNEPLTDKIVGKLYYDGTLIDKQVLPIIYNGKDGETLEVNGSVAKSMTMRNDTAVVMDENDEVIGELTAEPGNSVAETFEPEQLEWWSDSVNCEDAHQTASGSSVIGVSSFNGVAKKGSGFITNSVTDSILKTDLNIDSLMNEIINRLGGIPIVHKVSITSNGENVTGLYLHNGESITITAEENVSIDGVLDNNNQPLTLALENGQYVGTGTVAQNVEQVTLSGNNGTSTISVLPTSQVTPDIIPAPTPTPTGIGAAIQFSWELVDGSEHMEYMFSANYVAGKTADSSDMTLHLSKAGVVKEINGDDTDPMIEQTLSEIPVTGDMFEIFVSFSNVSPGTIIKAWVTGNAEFDGSTTSHASKTVYFKIPEPTTISVIPS